MKFIMVLLLIFLKSLVVIGTSAVNYNGSSIRVVAENLTLGEGPFWDSVYDVLYFVDISQHRVYRSYQNRLEHVQLGM